MCLSIDISQSKEKEFNIDNFIHNTSVKNSLNKLKINYFS